MLAALFGGTNYSNGYAQEENPPAVTTDLRLLPRPIYQPNLTTPGAASLVVPDAPTADEMKAALIVAAGFGRMSNGELALSFLTASRFSATAWANQDLIFVGKPSAFPMLAQASLPAPSSGAGYTLSEMQPEDGILQMAVSPWDKTHVVLVVGGNTDAGVIKAAQALSTGNIQTGSNPSLAIVAGVRAGGSTVAGGGGSLIPPSTDRTFRDINYERKFVTVSQSQVDYQFDIPPGYYVGEGPYLDLVFGNSTLLDYTSSNLEVYLNDHYIGGSHFSDGTAKSGTLRISIRPSLFVSGTNFITILVNLSPLAGAAEGSFGGAMIEPESLIHVPLEPATISASDLQNLGNYPYPFINDPALANVAFILPQQNLAAWDVAVQIAFNLGRSANGAPFDLAIAYDGQIPEEVRRNHDLIIIGLPMELAIITELRNALPAPFEEGSNVAILTNLPVEYRLPEGVELGYLELLNAPWDSARTILAVLGNATGGVQQAGGALTRAALRSTIKGDFALINGETISSTDTRTGSVVESVVSGTTLPPSVEALSTGMASVQTPSVSAASRDWVPVVVIGLVVMMAIIIMIGVISGIGRKKTVK
ncbi:MAG: hypothetical protein COX20_02725 [Desulfobacterales bacterium CG23_combo_of_CG06-09_8_20_14_all_52_9]|nr:MAG: hypothetical protein COX20_02725 [Desulfobacterales bacterium CG23_combo_of_CG06-09_8_20_14_all_52_9]